MIAAWLAALRREEKWATARLSERLPAIRRASIILCLLATLVICASAQKNPTTVQAQKRRIVIGASMLLDGRGHVLRDTRIRCRRLEDRRARSECLARWLRPARLHSPARLDRLARPHHLEFRRERQERGCGRDDAVRRVPGSVQCLADVDGGLYNRAERRLAHGRSAARRDRERSASGSAHPHSGRAAW